MQPRRIGLDPMNKSHPWEKLLTGVRGATKYAKAIARGDFVDVKEFVHRREVCQSCVSLTIEGKSSWCGEPFVDNTNHEDLSKRTCGCNLAGKLRVASERCPQGKW